MASFPVLHAPITSGGIKYSLHHLQPFQVKLDGKGKDGLDLTIRISYHSHVYSKTDNDGTTGLRFKDEGGNWREFCIQRHTLCLGLPAVCKDMVEQNYPSWQSQDGGSKNHMAVSEAMPSSGLKYLVFYELLPGEVIGIDVELVVKSAYEKQFDASRTGKRHKVIALARTVLFSGQRLPK